MRARVNESISLVVNVYHPHTAEVKEGIAVGPSRCVEGPTHLCESPSTADGAGSAIAV